MVHDIIILIIGLIIGLVIGFFVTRKVIANQMKKNPPINEDMIVALMSQMGRKPNKKQINQMMNTVKKYQ